MRAVFCEIDNDTVMGAEVNIDGDRAHHLNVVRLKTNEDLLVLNGKGFYFYSKVLSISKKEIMIKIVKVESAKPKHQITLAIAMPKKEAFEDILKNSVELGISQIFPLSSDFSQYNFEPNERVEKILESALVQSNNLYLPGISQQETLADFLNKFTGPLVYFSAQPAVSGEKVHRDSKVTVLIGPEAGFSPTEEEQIRTHKNIIIIHLPTPILRAPTAVATSVGYLLGCQSGNILD